MTRFKNRQITDEWEAFLINSCWSNSVAVARLAGSLTSMQDKKRSSSTETYKIYFMRNAQLLTKKLCNTMKSIKYFIPICNFSQITYPSRFTELRWRRITNRSHGLKRLNIKERGFTLNHFNDHYTKWPYICFRSVRQSANHLKYIQDHRETIDKWFEIHIEEGQWLLSPRAPRFESSLQHE